jgi:hypothetical protein
MKFGVLRHTRRPLVSLKTQNFQAKSRMVASSLSSPPNIFDRKERCCRALSRSVPVYPHSGTHQEWHRLRFYHLYFILIKEWQRQNLSLSPN